MQSEKHDKIFYRNVDNPEIVACVMHSHIRAIETFEVPLLEQHDFFGVKYGLCSQCLDMLEIDPMHKFHIEQEILMRLKQL